MTTVGLCIIQCKTMYKPLYYRDMHNGKFVEDLSIVVCKTMYNFTRGMHNGKFVEDSRGLSIVECKIIMYEPLYLIILCIEQYILYEFVHNYICMFTPEFYEYSNNDSFSLSPSLLLSFDVIVDLGYCRHLVMRGLWLTTTAAGLESLSKSSSKRTVPTTGMCVYRDVLFTW